MENIVEPDDWTEEQLELIDAIIDAEEEEENMD